MKFETTNPELFHTIRSLKKKANETGAAVWDDVADFLKKPKHRKVAVNISRINRYTKSGDKAIVPGKILSAGFLDHSVHVAAFSFTQKARDKILKAKGQCYTINEFIDKFPKGKEIKIIG
ncbi:50S ribosomal protein L18e [Candidatus Bathyarchaeota archaeon]|nr:50S ribosomal protein L18e [Candidatus Bathyarchaeota archaeon]